MKPIYFPREDSEMLAEQVRKFSKGVVLDIGTGTGIQAQAAAMSKHVKKVYAVDINPDAIKFCQQHSKSNSKIKYFVSDLFGSEKLKGKKFDTIIFNPPYLPADHEKEDIAVIGGKKGYEVIERFLIEVNNFLACDGMVLIVFSSLTNKQKVDEIIAKNFFETKILNTTRVFYETLYVYMMHKNNVSKKLSKLGVTSLQYLAKGKRKIVYTGTYKWKKVAIKIAFAGKRTSIEAKFLKKLGKYKFVPKLLYADNEFIISEFVDGTFLKDYVPKASKQQLKWLLNEVLRQCFALDCLKINKEEMHRPFKHVLINGKKIMMIDFERCRHTLQPKNVTQFCQYIANQSNELNKKGFKLDRSEIMFHAREYKENPSKKTFTAITGLLENGH